MGSSLCVLFNAMRPVSLIEDSRCQLNLGSANDCKAATYHFLQGIKKELSIPDSESFMIHNLYSDDTNGFVKVCFPFFSLSFFTLFCPGSPSRHSLIPTVLLAPTV